MSIKTTPLLHGGIELDSRKSDMTYGQFKKISQEKDAEFRTHNLSAEQIEDIYWKNITTAETHYAADNDRSLFSDEVLTWNLNKFTRKDSNIHFKQTHDMIRVSFEYIF